MSDVKEAPSTQRCEVCGREMWRDGPIQDLACLRPYGRGGEIQCYRLGYERLRERISFLEKQLAERKGP